MRAASFVTLFCFAAYGADTIISPQSVILPAEFGPALVKSCWNVSPIAGDISGYWSLNMDAARQMEHALPAYLKHSAVRRPLSDYYRQYVGIIAGGKRLVFVSAFAKHSPEPDGWTRKPIIMCGGYSECWRVAFYPQTKQFSHWDVNGPL
jgi:hypothetical protein